MNNVEQIIAQLLRGVSLIAISQIEGMPSLANICHWLTSKEEDCRNFQTLFLGLYKMQIMSMQQEILSIADAPLDATADWRMELQHRRSRIAARKDVLNFLHRFGKEQENLQMRKEKESSKKPKNEVVANVASIPKVRASTSSATVHPSSGTVTPSSTPVLPIQETTESEAAKEPQKQATALPPFSERIPRKLRREMERQEKKERQKSERGVLMEEV